MFIYFVYELFLQEGFYGMSEKFVMGDEFFELYGMRILRALRQIIRAVNIHSRKLNNDFKITSPQLICLYSLQRKGEMTLSEMAQEVNLGMSTVNGIVNRLEEKKMLTRVRSDKDRRKVIIRLTGEGQKITKAAPALLQKRFATELKKLPEQEQLVIALSLERVVKLMEAEHLDASPNLLPGEKINERIT